MELFLNKLILIKSFHLSLIIILLRTLMYKFFASGSLWLLTSICFSLLALFLGLVLCLMIRKREKKIVPELKKIFENGVCWLKNHLRRLRPHSVYTRESSSKKTDYNPPNPGFYPFTQAWKRNSRGSLAKKGKKYTCDPGS